MSQSRTDLLLLLPNPPSDVSFASLRAAYAPAFSRVISKASDLVKSRTFDNVSLDIAISGPDFDVCSERAHLYYHTQSLIGLLYQLWCVVCVEQSVDIALGNDVDARIFLIGSNSGNNQIIGLLEGPIIDLESLARSQRSWSQVFSIESENGESMLSSFIELHRTFSIRSPSRDFIVERVAGGTSVSFSRQHKPEEQRPWVPRTRHYSIAVGGTFDHLHAGHKLLLTATALLLDPSSESSQAVKRCLTIGITGDELLRNKKYAEYMQSWDERQKATYQFLLAIIVLGNPAEAVKEAKRFSDEGPNGRAIHYELHSGLILKFVEISDPFGPTVTDESITALVVSGETRSGGKAVNDKRTAKGWSALEIFEVDVLDQSDDGRKMNRLQEDFSGKISSTEIRRRLCKV